MVDRTHYILFALCVLCTQSLFIEPDCCRSCGFGCAEPPCCDCADDRPDCGCPSCDIALCDVWHCHSNNNSVTSSPSPPPLPSPPSQLLQSVAPPPPDAPCCDICGCVGVYCCTCDDKGSTPWCPKFPTCAECSPCKRCGHLK